MNFRSDKIFKMETVNALRCFKILTEKKKQARKRMKEEKKSRLFVYYLLQHRTQSRIKKNVYSETIHKTVLIFRILFVFLFAQFQRGFQKKSVIRN